MRLVDAADVTGEGWLGFDWADWRLLSPGTGKMAEIPAAPGLFRVCRVNGDGLDYAGQTVNLHDRLGHLANRVSGEDRPRYSQASAEHLWELVEDGGRYEVSYATPPIARSETDRIGLEHVMFDAHLRATGHTPTVNCDRSVGADPLDLDREAGGMTGTDWLGLDWTEPIPLRDRTAIAHDRVVYRIWYPGFTPPLAYIGKSTNVANRLIKHESAFGPDARVSVAPLPGRLKDVEAALIADHYLRTNTLPKGQNGRRNRFAGGK